MESEELHKQKRDEILANPYGYYHPAEKPVNLYSVAQMRNMLKTVYSCSLLHISGYKYVMTMKLKEKILNYLRNEYKLIDELSVDEYIMKRKDSILQNHIDNVYPIKTPGEGWKDQRYYWTKLTPQCRGYEHKIYAKTQEELETKIVAYYLNILDDRKLTLENLDANWEKQKTPKTLYLSAF